MKTSDFDYNLPKKFISLAPARPRDASRLMVLDRKKCTILHKHFFELAEILEAKFGKNTVLVFNDSRVIPARILFKINMVSLRDSLFIAPVRLQRGVNVKCEILLLKKIKQNIWECMVKPGRKFKTGNKIKIRPKITAEILDIFENGVRKIKFSGPIAKIGTTPFPPYLSETRANATDYQTIYAKYPGSSAAPTAGLHFTKRLMARLKSCGIKMAFTTLHVGLGTFQPVKTEHLQDHKMHSEYFTLSKNEADFLNKAKKAGKKIIAVGTTSVRVLETCADATGKLRPRTASTDIFIYPGYKWRFVDGMITNFHLPKSTLIMLVSAFASRKFIMRAYENAKKHNYRFYSFGDAMLII